MKKIIVLLCFCSVLAACVSSRTTPLKVSRLEFGSGGGVTGMYKSFVIDMKQKNLLTSDNKLVRKLEKKEIETIRIKLKETDFLKIDFNHPHNMSYYILLKGESNHKITWGDPAYPVPEKVKELYSFLVEIVKN